MLIISKYKDFYDYLKGIYGEDEKLVLDRREGDAKPYTHRIITLYICDKVIQGYNKDGIIYWGKEELDKITVENPNKWDLTSMFTNETFTHIIDTGMSKWNFDKINCNLEDDIKETNSINDCAIMLGDNKYPNLSYINFTNILTPKEIWVMLSEWLGRKITEKEPIVPIGDDKLRIQSHGFDTKTSFRPKIKL